MTWLEVDNYCLKAQSDKSNGMWYIISLQRWEVFLSIDLAERYRRGFATVAECKAYAEGVEAA